MATSIAPAAKKKPAARAWSEKEYLAFERESGNRMLELADGVLEILPIPGMFHQDLVQFLFLALLDVVKDLRLGRVYMAPLPIKLWRRQLREPDIALVESHRIKDKHKPPQGAGLVMEVVSPGTKNRQRDLDVKRRVYARAKIPEYWIVDPKTETITVLTLAGKSYKMHGVFKPGETATSKVLDGFAVNVTDLFAAGDSKS